MRTLEFNSILRASRSPLLVVVLRLVLRKCTCFGFGRVIDFPSSILTLITEPRLPSLVLTPPPPPVSSLISTRAPAHTPSPALLSGLVKRWVLFVMASYNIYISIVGTKKIGVVGRGFGLTPFLYLNYISVVYSRRFLWVLLVKSDVQIVSHSENGAG